MRTIWTFRTTASTRFKWKARTFSTKVSVMPAAHSCFLLVLVVSEEWEYFIRSGEGQQEGLHLLKPEQYCMARASAIVFAMRLLESMVNYVGGYEVLNGIRDTMHGPVILRHRPKERYFGSSDFDVHDEEEEEDEDEQQAEQEQHHQQERQPQQEEQHQQEPQQEVNAFEQEKR